MSNKEQKTKQFDDMLDILYNNMSNIDSDEDFKKVKTFYSNKISGIDPITYITSGILKRTVTYPSIYENFKGGKWDLKVPAKEVADQFYLKTDKNTKGKPATVFGTKIPGDDEHIYDHDFWGNISYGYILKKAGLPDWEMRGAAETDDYFMDKTDDDMVQLGMKLYDKYGDKLTKENLRQEILDNKDILRRYKNEELSDRRYRTQGGEDINGIAKKYDLTAEQLLDYNESHKQGVKGLSKEQSLLPGVKPLLPDPEESFMMQQDNLSNHDGKSQSNYDNLLKAMEEHNNPKMDILYKHPRQITESELKENMRYAGYEVQDPRLKAALQGKTKDWFDYYYGTEPIKRDASGRQIDSEPKHLFAQEVSALMSKDSIPMDEAFKQVAEAVSPLGVKALQKGLNSLNAEDFNQPELKEDGILGPMTTARIKDSLVTNGLNEVNKSIRTVGFNSMLEENRKKEVDRDTLNNTMNAIRPQDGGLFLQKGLNEVGKANLKEDNDIGSKTTDAFNQLKEQKEEALKSYVKDNLDKEIEKQKEDIKEEKERIKEQEREEAEQQKAVEQEEAVQAQAEADAAAAKAARDAEVPQGYMIR